MAYGVRAAAHRGASRRAHQRHRSDFAAHLVREIHGRGAPRRPASEIWAAPLGPAALKARLAALEEQPNAGYRGEILRHGRHFLVGRSDRQIVTEAACAATCSHATGSASGGPPPDTAIQAATSPGPRQEQHRSSAKTTE